MTAEGKAGFRLKTAGMTAGGVAEGCGRGVGFAWLSWGFGVPDVSEQIVRVSKAGNGIISRKPLTKRWTDWKNYQAVAFDFERK